MASIGRYELLRRLQTGAESEVYLARASGPGDFEKLLVLKLATAAGAENAEYVEQFLGEARIAARLDHSNIVQVFDVGSEGGKHFLTMEYVEGPSLRQLLDREKAAGRGVPIAFAVNLAAQLCDGLSYAHTLKDRETGEQLGVIHRDVCPQNVLLSKTGVAKLTDFGLARAVDATRGTALRGQAHYLAPEVIESAGKYEPGADLFAVGVVLYEMITGVLPFTGQTQEQLLKAIVSAQLVPASRHRSEVPPALDAVLRRALSREPDQRYASAADLGAGLDVFLSTLPALTAADLAKFIEGDIPEITAKDAPAEVVKTYTDLPPVVSVTRSDVETEEVLSIDRRLAVQTTTDLKETGETFTDLAAVSSAQTTRRLPHIIAVEDVETRKLERPPPRKQSSGSKWQGWALALIVLGIGVATWFELRPVPPTVVAAAAPIPRPNHVVVSAPVKEATPEPEVAVLTRPEVAAAQPASAPQVSSGQHSGGSGVSTPYRIKPGDGAPRFASLKQPRPGQVRISAKVREIPVRAQVFIGRDSVGYTPLFLSKPAGFYLVRVVFKKLQPFNIEVQVSKDQGGVMDVELDPEP